MTAGRWKKLVETEGLTGERPKWLTVDVSDEFLKRSSNNNPRVPSMVELKDAYLRALASDPSTKNILLDKIVVVMKDAGHDILWTPPYCPDLQPIEIFWAHGKGHAAQQYRNGNTMKQCIQALREGWYGGIYPEGVTFQRSKEPSDIEGILRKVEEEANKRIKQLEGLHGTLASLTWDADADFYEGDPEGLDAYFNTVTPTDPEDDSDQAVADIPLVIEVEEDEVNFDEVSAN